MRPTWRAMQSRSALVMVRVDGVCAVGRRGVLARLWWIEVRRLRGPANELLRAADPLFHTGCQRLLGARASGLCR